MTTDNVQLTKKVFEIHRVAEQTSGADGVKIADLWYGRARLAFI
jgi:hypothetical protein